MENKSGIGEKWSIDKQKRSVLGEFSAGDPHRVFGVRFSLFSCIAMEAIVYTNPVVV